MLKILRLAWKNLLRYKRRSLLTGLMITFGMVAVIVFVGLSGSFKKAVVGQITDSFLSHIQIHKKGYLASIDNLPLDRSLTPKAYEKLAGILGKESGVEAFSPRIKFSAMLSNYAQTTNVRLNGIEPDKEMRTVPLLSTRLTERSYKDKLLQEGEVFLPESMATGMGIKLGDTIVLVANNKDGSVNGMTFKVAGIVEGLMGPGGRDGYIHLKDAARLLRMKKPEISEIAIRVKNFDNLEKVAAGLKGQIALFKNQKGKPAFELHTWAQLTPFYNIVRMINMMNLGIKVILIAVVLISVLNVMMMSVYERISEIGALAAMGTSPGRIRGLFVAEGFSLGLISSLAGAAIGVGILLIFNVTGLEVAFGRSGMVFTLEPTIAPLELVWSFAIVLLVSVLASLQPAAKAARLEPVEALRHV
jgi:putative ABC transport system permease protein